MNQYSITALLTLFLLLPAAATVSAEEVKEPVCEIPEAQSSRPGFFWSSLDKYHSFLQSKIDDPVLWFDAFFGDRLTEEEEYTSAFIRFRSLARYTEGEGFTFPVRLHANVQLPQATRRLRLILTGENEDDPRDVQTDDAIDPGLAAGNEGTNLGLRYTIYRTLRSKLHFGGGLKVRIPFEYYARVRYRRLLHIGSKNLIRFTETGYWNSLDGFGESSRLDLERQLSGSTVGRISSTGTYSEISQGVDWGAEISLYKQLCQKSAFSIDFGAYGITRPHTEVSRYRIGTRYRRNVFRPWFFFEVEPEVSWPLSEEGHHRDAVSAITFVMEIQFAN